MLWRALKHVMFSRPGVGCIALKPGEVFCCDQGQINDIKWWAQPVDWEAWNAVGTWPPPSYVTKPRSIGWTWPEGKRRAWMWSTEVLS